MSNKNITILYVDDEEINLFIFKKSFESVYNVITAKSALEGLGILKEHENDIIVVISDMRMPVMNGVEFIIKAKELYKNIAYFILTGFEYNDEIEEALKSKVIQNFFTKPLDIEKIQRSIKEAIVSLELE